MLILKKYPEDREICFKAAMHIVDGGTCKEALKMHRDWLRSQGRLPKRRQKKQKA